jgi:signal transduction histidine kinase/HAMP domain-containing protein
MRRASLRSVLIALNVAVALVAVAGLAIASAALLRKFIDEQALDRVRAAAGSAERGVAREGEALTAIAHLVAGQPGLAAGLAARRNEDAVARLATIRATTGITAAAVVRNGRVVASSGPELDWTTLAQNPGTAPWTLATPAAGGIELAAATPLASDPAYVVVVASVFDAVFAERLGATIGAGVRFDDATHGVGDLGDPKLPLRARLLHDAPPEAKRLDALGTYAMVVALKGADGRVAGFLEVDIPTKPARDARLRLMRRVGQWTLAVGLLALIAGIVVSRRIAAPLERLTEAADRIGGGDLATPVGAAGWAEIGRLASSMEDMRRRLHRLTHDLEAQQSEARAMVDGIVEGVYVVDGERRVVQMNPQAATLLGVDPAKAIGMFCGDILNPESTGPTRPCEENCPILHARFRGEARATERLVLADGRRRTVVVTSSMSGGERQFQLLRDETEVEAARRLRDAVLANISHEFKTPLAAQLASLELLVDKLPELGPDETRALVVSLQRGALRLSQLIDNLLESVRIEAGRVVLRKRDAHLDEVVEEAVEMIRPLAEQRRQTIEIDLPHPLPVVAGDAPRLVQVFVNLLANAGKFAPDGSTIRIGGEVTGGHVALWVDDEGPGWSEDVEPQLFEPFVRSMGEEPESSGVGLGLYIAKSIIERHGGSIDARTGSGRTRVAVKLPLGAVTGAPA